MQKLAYEDSPDILMLFCYKDRIELSRYFFDNDTRVTEQDYLVCIILSTVELEA